MNSFVFRDITSIVVQLQREGIHCYPDAPEEVAFLRSPHRHMFHICVELQVHHDDRELEFIIVKRDLEKWLDLNSLDYKSCEMITKDILDYLHGRWGISNRITCVSVFEDGENGGRTVRIPVNV